ncbi:MAG: MFS transporter [Verrucomicrobiales bacterium]|nr:MFS transporter [Verrucomicrobiales bacterium]
MTRPSSSWHHVALVAGILLVALNLRPAVTAISPLAERMHTDGLSRELIGMLTTIPLILFGLMGLWAGWVGGRFGLARAMGGGLLILGLGCFIRSAPGELSDIWRILGTIMIGAGIAVGNVLMPGIVKSRYPHRVGLMTSLYSTGMNLGAALGIAFAVPLAAALPGDWNTALAAWGVLALVTLLIWSPQMIPPPTVRPTGHPLRGVMALAKKGRAWQIAIFMGFQSMVFYSSVAWLPTVLQHRGMTETQAAWWVSALQIVGCAASLAAPILAGKFRSQSLWSSGFNFLSAVSLALILILPLKWVGAAVIGLGIGVNASFGTALLILAVRSHDARTAASLSSMAQAVGYLMASPGPWIAGLLSTTAWGWNASMGFVVVLGLLASFFGFLAGRERTLSLDAEEAK